MVGGSSVRCPQPHRFAQQFEGTSDLGIRIAGALAEVVGVVLMQQGAAAITAAVGGQALLLFSKAEGGAWSETSVKQEASRSS